LENLDKAHVLVANNVFTLIIHAHVNWNSNNYDVTLKTLDEANVFPAKWSYYITNSKVVEMDLR
jgi:hypothetical protein